MTTTRAVTRSLTRSVCRPVYRTSGASASPPAAYADTVLRIANRNTKYLSNATPAGGLAADTSGFVLSMWIRFDDVTNAQTYFSITDGSLGRIRLYKSAGHALSCLAMNTDSEGQSSALVIASPVSASQTWHHVMIACDAVADRILAYYDGALIADQATSVGFATPTFDLSYAGSITYVMANMSGTTIARSSIFDVQFYPVFTDDLSLFYSAGDPVDPATAQATLGTPAVLLSGERAGDFGTNADGDGGAFTQTGTGYFEDVPHLVERNADAAFDILSPTMTGLTAVTQWTASVWFALDDVTTITSRLFRVMYFNEGGANSEHYGFCSVVVLPQDGSYDGVFISIFHPTDSADPPTGDYALYASTGTALEVGRLYHIMVTYDTTAGYEVWVDGVLADSGAAYSATAMNFTKVDQITVGNGILWDNTPYIVYDHANVMDGAIGEVWFTTGYRCTDVTVFRSADGVAQNLKPDGTGPTGSAPLVYCRGVAADWNSNAANRGTAGTLTRSTTGAVTGSVTDYTG